MTLRAPLLSALLLAGCDLHPEATTLLVMDRDDQGDYALAARQVPERADRRRLDGELGRGWRGGLLVLDGYESGAPLDIAWTLDGDTAVALDEDGMVLWSFYRHLALARDDIEDRGWDTSALFPVHIAYNPVSVMDFQAAENAAYASSLETFVLFPDMVTKGVPLATNAGVVRHELGHAWFQWLVVGDMDTEAPWIDLETGQAVSAPSALNEGFADAVATLLLDDPRFIEASLPLDERDVTGDWVAGEDKYPGEDDDPLLGYDPYPLGTVFASMAWDVREATDPDTALELVVAALQAWAEVGDWSDVDRWALLLVEQAGSVPDAHQAACTSLELRFPHLQVPASCSR